MPSSLNVGTPIAGCCRMENPRIEWMIDPLGVPAFYGTSMSGCLKGGKGGDCRIVSNAQLTMSVDLYLVDHPTIVSGL